MAERVDHKVRRLEIALKATHLFSQVGYDNVTLSQIAAVSGVARTVLYRYYKDKREVLDDAIRANTRRLMENCLALSSTVVARAPERLKAISCRVADALVENKDFLIAIYDFVLAMIRHGEDMSGRIIEFTRGMPDLLNRLLTAGVAEGSIAAGTDIVWAGDMLFGEMELLASRIVLGLERDSAAAKRRITGLIDQIALPA